MSSISTVSLRLIPTQAPCLRVSAPPRPLELQHVRKSRYRRASGLRRWWRDGHGIAQFSKVVKGALSPRDQSVLRHNFGIRAAVPNSVVENFPYDAYLIMRDRPSSLLGAKPRTPALEAPLGLAAFRRYGRPSCLAECAPQHPVPFGRAAAYRRACAFLLAWTHPAHGASLPATANASARGPVSAMMCCAVRTLMPGISHSRSIAS